jgi:hypothetical protein
MEKEVGARIIRRRNFVLATVAVLLLLLNVLLFKGLHQAEQQNDLAYKFAVQDTSLIQQIEMTRRGEMVSLQNENGQWVVNQKWPSERSLSNLLKAVLYHQQVRRVLGEKERQLAEAELQEHGVEVKVNLKGLEPLLFTAGGNAAKTRAYFKAGDEYYAMFIPGYENYLSGIYEMSTLDWRDRSLYRGTLGTLKEINLSMLDANQAGFQIHFTADGFRWIEKPDYTEEKLRDFLRSLNGIYADLWVPVDQYEKVIPFTQKVMASLQLIDIDKSRSVSFYFYDLPEDTRFYLGKWQNIDEYFLISRERLSVFLKGPALN